MIMYGHVLQHHPIPLCAMFLWWPYHSYSTSARLIDMAIRQTKIEHDKLYKKEWYRWSSNKLWLVDIMKGCIIYTKQLMTLTMVAKMFTTKMHELIEININWKIISQLISDVVCSTWIYHTSGNEEDNHILFLGQICLICGYMFPQLVPSSRYKL